MCWLMHGFMLLPNPGWHKLQDRFKTWCPGQAIRRLQHAPMFDCALAQQQASLSKELGMERLYAFQGRHAFQGLPLRCFEATYLINQPVRADMGCRHAHHPA